MSGENGKDELIILLLNLAHLQLEHYIIEFCEEVIECFEIGWMERDQLILQLIDPQIILLVK